MMLMIPRFIYVHISPHTYIYICMYIYSFSIFYSFMAAIPGGCHANWQLEIEAAIEASTTDNFNRFQCKAYTVDKS